MNPWLETTIRIFGTAKWAVLKRQRLLAYRRAFPNGKVSRHFTYREFFCRDGMPPPTRAIPHLRWYCNNILEPMRKEFGGCTITGPYRHYWYNKRVVKGATASYHVWDRYVDGTVKGSAIACDLSFVRGGPSVWARSAELHLRNLGRGGGIGIYNAGRFTHVDTRRQAARWNGP